MVQYMKLNESKELAKGVFWVIADTEDQLEDSNLLYFPIYCDADGNSTQAHTYTAKSGTTDNHEKVWAMMDKQDTKGKSFCYYPRGRVEIRNATAHIYANPILADMQKDIERAFGLHVLRKVIFHADGSEHYKCHFDKQ